MSIIKICPVCNREYKARRQTQICCSKKCSEIKKHGVHFVKCDNCGKEYRIKYSDLKRSVHHYCSIECKNEHQKVTMKGTNNPSYGKTTKQKRKCVICGEEFIYIRKTQIYCSVKCRTESRKKRSKTKCDYCNKEIYKTTKEINRSIHNYCSNECKHKHQKEILKGEKNPNYGNRGKSNPLWKADKTDDERNFRREYIEGYNSFIKDKLLKSNYTCDVCHKHGGDLNVHHLNGFNWDIEHRLDFDNAVVLCKECHRNFHNKYGYGDNTKEQYLKWISESA